MERREFIKKASIGSTLPFWLSACEANSPSFPIHVRSDHHIGHILRDRKSFRVSKKITTETLIVGGGIAGLSAAYSLGSDNFILAELSDRFGGTSGALKTPLPIAQGAHYELEYPEYYGEEVLQTLENLNIIHYQAHRNTWSFNDSQHLIPTKRRQQCLLNGKLTSDVLPEGKAKQEFIELMISFTGKMPLPTRLIAEELKPLNKISFKAFLDENAIKSEVTFRKGIDYHLIDDYGAGASEVSALAGIHYFACRPYYNDHVALFSPPEGNAYFVDKFKSQLPTKSLKSGYLAYSIEKSGFEYLTLLYDVRNKQSIEVRSDNLIYAGQKHALPYIFPDLEYQPKHEYAPWMVVNIIGKQEPGKYGYWQNEHLDNDLGFLGFVDSSVQAQSSIENQRVLTGYYCLQPTDREYLLTIPENKERILEQTSALMNQLLDKPFDIQQAHINVMGHAMPIPSPGYLFQEHKLPPGMQLAGVDSGRLPLLFEAIDSGILAAQML